MALQACSGCMGSHSLLSGRLRADLTLSEAAQICMPHTLPYPEYLQPCHMMVSRDATTANSSSQPIAAFMHVFLFKSALHAPSAAHPKLPDTSPAQMQLTGQRYTYQKHSGLVETPHVIIVGAVVARDPARAEVDPHAAVWALLQNLPQCCAIVGNACAWLQVRLAVLQGQLRRL